LIAALEWLADLIAGTAMIALMLLGQIGVEII